MEQDPLSDSIRLTQNGEAQAFQVIVKRYQHPLFIWVTRFLGTGVAPDAEDIVQEIFLSAYTHIQSFDPVKAGFSTWLFIIARNLCLNKLRKKRPESREDIEAVSSLNTNNPEHRLLDREMHRKMDQALKRLSPKYRSVFILYEFIGFNHRDISIIEGIRIGTVKSRLSRARKELRKKLNQYWNQYKERP